MSIRAESSRKEGSRSREVVVASIRIRGEGRSEVELGLKGVETLSGPPGEGKRCSCWIRRQASWFPAYGARQQCQCRGCVVPLGKVRRLLTGFQGLDNFVEGLGLISDAAGLRGIGRLSRRPTPRSGRLQLRDNRRHVDKRGSTKFGLGLCESLWMVLRLRCLFGLMVVWFGWGGKGREEEGEARAGQGSLVSERGPKFLKCLVKVPETFFWGGTQCGHCEWSMSLGQRLEPASLRACEPMPGRSRDGQATPAAQLHPLHRPHLWALASSPRCSQAWQSSHLLSAHLHIHSRCCDG